MYNQRPARVWQPTRPLSLAGSKTVFDRRRLLRTVGLGTLGTVLADPATARQPTDSSKLSVTLDDQESDATSIIVTEVATDIDSLLLVENDDGDVIAGETQPIRFDAGDVETDVRIKLEELLTESQRLTAVLVESNGSARASDSADVMVSEALPESTEGFEPTLVEADPDSGFHYPYFLYAPDRISDDDPRPILVQPNNTGTSTDDFDEHLESARRDADGGFGRQVSDGLDAPLLVPVFPRPRSTPVDGTHYVHQLDATTMAIEGGDLERVDRQLVNMVEHAQQRLAERSYPVANTVMLNGYSASGNFVDRFATLHPDQVTSVSAGGVNGMLVLPLEEAKGHTLNYHIGIANVEALTGDPFDLEGFADVNRFVHMGELDTNDTIPFGDAWTDEEQREIALDVYGDDMQEDRLPYCRSVFDDVGASAVFRIYEGAGHTPRPAVDDVIEFHRRSLAGDDIEDIRTDLGGNVVDPNANFVHEPQEPVVGDRVAFDASGSDVWDRELVEYSWEFGDGETGTGELATHTFDAHGGHNVVLTVTDDTGETYRAVQQVVVGRNTESAYKFLGISGAVAGFGSAAYVIYNRMTGASAE